MKRLNLLFKKLLFLIILFGSTFFLYQQYKRRVFIGEYRSPHYKQTNQGCQIEKNIFQAWKDDDVPSEKSKLSWSKMNPGYNYTLVYNHLGIEYIKEKFPDVFPLFDRVPESIMKWDLFRYLIIYDKGGVYSDIDTECIKSIDEWTKGFNSTINAIVGVEFDASDHIVPWFSPCQLQLLQWTFAAKAKHPIIQHIINTILFHYNTMAKEELEKVSVHDLTGPTLFTKAILDYFCRKGFCDWKRLQNLEEPVLIDDILVLPPTSFNPFSDMRGKGRDHKWSFVIHEFLGSWK